MSVGVARQAAKGDHERHMLHLETTDSLLNGKSANLGDSLGVSKEGGNQLKHGEGCLEMRIDMVGSLRVKGPILSGEF